MRLKRNRAESLGCHDRHPLPRVCLRDPGSRDVKNWQWRYVIHAQMICYRNNRYLHDVPECLLVKNCPTPPGLPIPVVNKIENAIQYKNWSPDWLCLAHTMTSARARGRSNRLLTAAICNTGVAVVLTRQQDIWDHRFCALRIVSKYACVFRVHFSDSGTQSKFWIRPVSIKRTNLQKSSTGKPAQRVPDCHVSGA